MVYTFKEVIEEQKRPLDYKIENAVEAIGQAFTVSKSAVGLAFSGGKDSTVLWHLVRTHFPDAEYHVIYANTTVEFMESLLFARRLGGKTVNGVKMPGEWADEEKVHFHEVLPEKTTEDGLKYQAQKEVLEWLIETGKIGRVLKPDGKLKSTAALERMATPEMMEDFERRNLIWKAGTTKSFNWCCDQYGYPILGKAAGKLTARRINIDCFLRFSASESEKEETLKYYDIIRKVKTSNHCCSVLKKEPSEKKQAELGIDVIMKGLMAEESRSRLLSFATRGYLFKSHRAHAPEFYHCSPLGIWTDADIWEYIHRFDVPYCSLYDMVYIGQDGKKHNVKRNGCVGCCTDIAFPDCHISVLRKTHPARWEFVMKNGMGAELMNLANNFGNEKKSYLQVARDVEEVTEQMPCAFDDMPSLIERNEVTESTYDSEIDGQMSLVEDL